MVQARLDALEPDARRVLRAASVFGQTFWRGGVAALLGETEPAGARLAHLVERELDRGAARVARVPGEAEYAFRHALVREAAYAMLTDADRALGHRLAGAWLADQASRRGRARGALRARARTSRGRPCTTRAPRSRRSTATTAPRDRARRPRPRLRTAARARGPAGARARRGAPLARRARAVAAAPADLALGFLTPGSETWFQAIDERFYAAGRSGDVPRAIGILRDLTATPALPGGELAQLRGVARGAIVMMRFGPPEVGAALAARCEELAVTVTTDLSTEQRLYTLRSMIARERGQAQVSIDLHGRALDASFATHNLREAAFTCLAWANVCNELGVPEESVVLAQRGIALGEKVGAATITPLLYFALAMAQVELDDHVAAQRNARTAIAGALEIDPAVEGLGRWTLARSLYATGELVEAAAEIAIAVERLATFTEYRSYALATQAKIAIAAGDIALARAAITEARRIVRPQNGFQEGEAFVRLCEIEVLEASGDPAVAEATAIAIGRLDARAARIDEPWRTRWLAKRHNAATLARRGG